jgi:hypothetical protein
MKEEKGVSREYTTEKEWLEDILVMESRELDLTKS